MLSCAVVLAVVAVSGGEDWNQLNAIAREQANAPVRAGIPEVRPFWNARAKAFIHPPAFDFKETAGAKEYRFTLARRVEDNAPYRKSWTAAKPWTPISAEVWGPLKPGC